MFSMTVTVDPKLERNLRDLAKRYPEACAIAMYEEMVEVMRESRRRAPFEEGELRESEYVTPSSSKGAPMVEGGYAAPYALVQHERTDFHHKRGEAKFLQRAVDARTSGMLERIGARTERLAQSQALSLPKSEFPTSPPATSSSKGKHRRRRQAAAQLRGRRRAR